MLRYAGGLTLLALLSAIVCIAASARLDWAAVTFLLNIQLFVVLRSTLAAALVTFWVTLSGGVALFVQQYGQQRRMPLSGPVPTTQAHGPLKNS